ncbi:MAG: hypothetical protein A3A86_04550 [Elusimicrobia bacterium RIFCSPLOWO2_01_FULL_60_11]|nr:MAG: hypothetical protein A3A86_04550 [Elusimicrobia bacterium RIFCSPLOWO2_01_FULL_60_11]
MDPTDPKSKTILVVDDDASVCELYQMGLSRQGFKTASVRAGDEALKAIKGGKQFDLILLDLMMPGRGGFDVLKDLQAAAPDIPIYVVTARAMDTSTFQMISMESNVKGVLTKPLNMKEFNAKVHETLGTIPAKAFDGWQG